MDAFEKDLAFTPEAFVHWKNNTVVNPNLVFKNMLGTKCFRSGIRRNNSSVALAGRQKVVPTMFLGKHDI